MELIDITIDGKDKFEYYEDSLGRGITFKNGALFEICENRDFIRFSDDKDFEVDGFYS